MKDLLFPVVLRRQIVARFPPQQRNQRGLHSRDVSERHQLPTQHLPQPIMVCVVVFRCRYGACELHSVAAYMGGVGAQEVIKIITEQFVPLNNTYIYNGIKQSSVTLHM